MNGIVKKGTEVLLGTAVYYAGANGFYKMEPGGKAEKISADVALAGELVDFEEEPCPECGEYMLSGDDEDDEFCDECGWPHFHEANENEDLRQCRTCGCTENTACVKNNLACSWAGDDVCSFCIDDGE